MTKPGFVLKRLKLLFESDDTQSQEIIVDKYNTWRNDAIKEGEKPCYCGHTITCTCAGPHISEFKSMLFNSHHLEDDGIIDILQF